MFLTVPLQPNTLTQTVFASPFGGVLADRMEKRGLLIWMQVVQCLISLLIGVLVALDRIEYWHLVVSAAIQGVSFAIMMPTRQSWIPQLVKRDELTSALAMPVASRQRRPNVRVTPNVTLAAGAFRFENRSRAV